MVQAIGGMLGGIIQSGAAHDAEKAQERAAIRQQKLQKEIFDYAKEIQAPYVDTGNLANAILKYELVGGPAPVIANGGYEVGGETYATRDEAENALAAATDRFNKNSAVTNKIVNPRMARDQISSQPGYYSGSRTTFDPAKGIAAAGFDPRGEGIETVDPVTYGGFNKTQDYNFGLNQGIGAVDASAAARGGLKSGATLKALTEYGQNYASQRRNQYLGQLFGLTGQGQASTNALQMAGQNYATGAGNAIGAFGNAQAAGAIAQGNITNGMVQNGFQGIASLASMFGGGGGGLAGMIGGAGGKGGFGTIASQLLGSF